MNFLNIFYILLFFTCIYFFVLIFIKKNKTLLMSQNKTKKNIKKYSLNLQPNLMDYETDIDPNVPSIFMNSIKEFNIPLKFIGTYSLVEPELNQYKKILLNPLFRTQGECGCCWAMSSIGLIESIMIQNGYLDLNTQLSVQQYIDCVSGTDTGKFGCHGADLLMVINDYTSKYNTLFTEKEFPYLLEDISHASYIGCDKYLKYNEPGKYIPDIDKYVVKDCQRYLKKIIYKYGPVIAAAMAVKKYDNPDENPFFLYDGGIFEDNAAGIQDVDYHAMLIVGWGQADNYVDYWILKNSYGEYWGQNGYIYIPIDRTPKGFSNFAEKIFIITLQRVCPLIKSSGILISQNPLYEDDDEDEDVNVANSKIAVTIHAIAYVSDRKQQNIIFKLISSSYPVNFVNQNNEIIDSKDNKPVTSNEKYYFNSEKGDKKDLDPTKNNWFIYKNRVSAAINYTEWKTTLNIMKYNRLVFSCNPLKIEWDVKIYIYNYDKQENKFFLYPLTDIPQETDIYVNTSDYFGKQIYNGIIDINRTVKEITYINLTPKQTPKKGRIYLYTNPDDPIIISNKYKIIY
jgi:hypothetical protein